MMKIIFSLVTKSETQENKKNSAKKSSFDSAETAKKIPLDSKLSQLNDFFCCAEGRKTPSEEGITLPYKPIY